jgi:CMP-N-acetylneuraminic acid synthetase
MILGVTLARGGSKGLPRKNIRQCAGKPLIAWTIEAALNAALLDAYVVSTEDNEIANIAKKHGATVARRPLHLAGGEVNRWTVMQDLTNNFPAAHVIVLLQATSPVRSSGLIDDCIRQYLDDQLDSLATGFYHHDSPYPENRGQNRQEMARRFFDDGNIYIWSRSLLETYPWQHAGQRAGIRITTELENIDINTAFDLWVAERILECQSIHTSANADMEATMWGRLPTSNFPASSAQGL